MSVVDDPRCAVEVLRLPFQFFFSSFRTASIKARTFSGSFLPGLASTPEATSTPQGFSMRIASATLLEFKPPATTILSLSGRIPAAAAFQSNTFPVPPGAWGVPESRKIALMPCLSNLIPVDAAIDLSGRKNQKNFQAVGFQRLDELGFTGRNAMQLRGGQT